MRRTCGGIGPGEGPEQSGQGLWRGHGRTVTRPWLWWHGERCSNTPLLRPKSGRGEPAGDVAPRATAGSAQGNSSGGGRSFALKTGLLGPDRVGVFVQWRQMRSVSKRVQGTLEFLAS